MDLEDSFILNLTAAEVEWILNEIQAPSMRLYPSPFINKPAEKMRKTLDNAGRSLLKRGWIENQPDDNVVIDITVAAMVGALGFAKTALFVEIFQEHTFSPQVTRYFSAEGLLIEQSASDDGEIILTALRNVQILHKQLQEHLDLKGEGVSGRGTFKCGAALFADVPFTLAGDGESAAIAQLIELGADARFAADLISAMNVPIQQSTLELIALDAQQPDGVRLAGRLNLIEGVYGLWVLRSYLEGETPFLEITPAAAAEAKGFVGELLNAFLAHDAGT